MSFIAEALIALGVEVTGAQEAEKAVGGVKDSTKKLDKEGGDSFESFAEKGDTSLKGLVKSFAGSQGAMLLGVGAIVAAVVAATKMVVEFVNETTAGIDAIAKNSEAAGITAETYQKWSVAAQHAGTTVETLTKATRKVNTSLLDVANGGGADFVANLDKIGLAASDLEGLDQQAQLGVLADALNNVSNKSERAALSAKLFGEEAGPQLANFLSQGSKGINEATGAVDNFLTDEQVAQAVKYQDTLTEFNQVMTVLKGELALALTPAIEGVVLKLQEWIEENKDGAESVMKVISLALKPLILILEALLIPIDLVVSASLDFYDAIVSVGEALVGLGEYAAKASEDWEWVQDLQTAFTKIGSIVDVAKDKVIEFIKQFEPLRRLAVKLGVIEGETGGALFGRAQQGLAGALLSGEQAGDAATNEALRTQAVTQGEAKAKADTDNRKNAAVAQHGARTKPLTKLEQDQIYGAVGDPTAARSAIDEINKKVVAPKKGRSGGKAKAEPVMQEVQLTSFEQLLQSTLGPGFEVRNLDMRKIEVDPAAIKPEAVVTVNNFDFRISQEINGQTDAKQIADASATAIRTFFADELARAGQALQPNLAR